MESAETVHDTIARAIRELDSVSEILREVEDAWNRAREHKNGAAPADLVGLIEAMVEQLGEALSEEPSALRDRALKLAGYAARLAEVVGQQAESPEEKAP